MADIRRLTDRQLALLAYVDGSGRVTAKAAARAFNVPRGVAARMLDALYRRSLVTVETVRILPRSTESVERWTITDRGRRKLAATREEVA